MTAGRDISITVDFDVAYQMILCELATVSAESNSWNLDNRLPQLLFATDLGENRQARPLALFESLFFN